ncbi:Rrf2 family transcriptional regulator [Devosia sp. WQ 349]|uniref:RrF2 family transcriptional regulator n=1 Tax=Devosia sp. WQ 349K1 TaxID=2800329 RepID=UPI0019079AA3|nr:Rrf2 family transcriptional regulator [Devosia sp. WQ 349K1]MBK1795258.1 Rrf2 family transcriptional regulator [Devosia sp. WQ 349K1]
MKRSSRLSTALHALVHLHAQPDKTVSSAGLATCLQTNPVVVRRILGELRDADIVTASKGPTGGWSLSRPAGEITLRDIYQALGERLLVRTESDPGDCSCAIVRSVDRVMHEFLEDAETLLSARLARTRLSDLATEAISAGFKTL